MSLQCKTRGSGTDKGRASWVWYDTWQADVTHAYLLILPVMTSSQLMWRLDEIPPGMDRGHVTLSQHSCTQCFSPIFWYLLTIRARYMSGSSFPAILQGCIWVLRCLVWVFRTYWIVLNHFFIFMYFFIFYGMRNLFSQSVFWLSQMRIIALQPGCHGIHSSIPSQVWDSPLPSFAICSVLNSGHTANNLFQRMW